MLHYSAFKLLDVRIIHLILIFSFYIRIQVTITTVIMMLKRR